MASRRAIKKELNSKGGFFKIDYDQTIRLKNFFLIAILANGIESLSIPKVTRYSLKSILRVIFWDHRPSSVLQLFDNFE